MQVATAVSLTVMSDGFTQIVVDYYDGLALCSARMCVTSDVAEELAQETFAKLVTKKPRFNGRSSFKSWLYSIGRNAALDHLRREKRRGAAPLDECAMTASDEDIEQNYLSSERDAALHPSHAAAKRPIIAMRCGCFTLRK